MLKLNLFDSCTAAGDSCRPDSQFAPTLWPYQGVFRQRSLKLEEENLSLRSENYAQAVFDVRLDRQSAPTKFPGHAFCACIVLV